MVPQEDLRWTCPTSVFTRARRKSLEPPDRLFGQDAAVAALRLAVALRDSGPDVYVSGPPATDPLGLALHVLERYRGSARVPDRVYLPDEDDPQRARLLELPAGAGPYVVRRLTSVLSVLRDQPGPEDVRVVADEFARLRTRVRDERLDAALAAFERTVRRLGPFVRFRPALAALGRDGPSPVVHERHPTSLRLFGGFAREDEDRPFDDAGPRSVRFFGGSLLRADGGFLVLEAEDVIVHRDLWRNLLKAVRDGRLEIPPLRSPGGDDDIALLRPDPIPFHLQIVLIGGEDTYARLFDEGPEFRDLVSIKATLETRTPRTDAAVEHHVRCLRHAIEHEGLVPFEPQAAASVVEEGVREAGRKDRITLCLGRVLDVVREASHEAEGRGAARVTREDVRLARSRAARRLGVLDRDVREAVLQGRILLDTDGRRVGEVNGLAVYDYGNLGKVARISATVGPGTSGIVNVEREVALSASSYDKGIHILAGYLSYVLARDSPAAFSARVVFEQSYGGISGDSATVAETLAVLSALSRVPLRQSLAVTGSMNQHGEVQAIGGVNDKVEGFFDLCVARGLTGEHGVVIPRSNVADLMLRPDLVDACRRGLFCVHAVARVEEALEILADRPCGYGLQPGVFAPGSVLAAAAERLDAFAVTREREAHGGAAPHGKAPAAVRATSGEERTPLGVPTGRGGDAP